MSSNNLLLKIPSLINMRTLSIDSNSSKPKFEEFDVDIESPSPIVVDEIVEERKVEENRSPRFSSFFTTNIFERTPDNGTTEKPVLEKNDLPMKKMLTKEEMELESKIATQNAMIELGKQMTEKKMREDRRIKNESKYMEVYEDFKLEDETLDEILEEKTEIDRFMDEYIIDNKEDFDEIGLKNKQQRIDFMKFVLVYSILKNKMSIMDERIEELEEDLSINNENMEDYIKELDDKDKLIKNLREKMSKQEIERVNEMSIYKKSINKLMIKSYGTVLFAHLLFFMIMLNGTNKSLKMTYILFCKMINCGMNIIHFVDMIMYRMIMYIINIKIYYLVVILLALMQVNSLYHQYGHNIINRFKYKKD